MGPLNEEATKKGPTVEPMSLTAFLQKWTESGVNTGISAQSAFQMSEDLRRVIEYAGGDIEKAFKPTELEAAHGLEHPEEARTRRKSEYLAWVREREARKQNQSVAAAREVEGEVQPPAGDTTTPAEVARGGRRR